MAEPHELEERALAAMQDEVLAGKGVRGGVRAVLDLVRQEQEKANEAMLIAARDWSGPKFGKPIGNDAANGCWGTMIRAWWLSHTAPQEK